MPSIASKILTGIIKVYQKTLSPDHGFLKIYHSNGYCRFYPSCSEYAKQSIQKHGAIKGVFLFLKRFVRCNPFNRGGVDPVD